MKTEEYGRLEMDRTLRGLHASAARSLSPSTLARLRDQRHDLSGHGRSRAFAETGGWLAAGLCSITLAVALGLQLAPSTPGTSGPSAMPPATTAATAPAFDYPAGLAALDEDPDLYIWLAAEAGPLQLEKL